MNQLSISDVQKLADLSQLTLTSDELSAMQTELADIVGYIDQLQLVDTDGVEPTYQVSYVDNVSRDDIVIDYGVATETLLDSAPDQTDGQIKVPRVLR